MGFRFSLVVAMLIFMMVSPCKAATETVLDTFSQKSYGNQDGTAAWSSDWREYNDDGSPNSGNLAIDQGALQFNGSNNYDPNNAIYVIRSVDLSMATSAALSFDFETVHLDDWWEEGEVALYISDNGGTTWTWLTNINWWDPQTGSWSGDISAYMSADTRIGFIQSEALSSDEGVYFDNIQISYQVPDPPQLVAHYALEGNVTDGSGNGHDGGSQGTVTYQRAKVCDGAQFDGSGYLQVPDNDDFDLPDELTVMAWIRPDSLSVSGHEDLYSILSKDTNYEFHVRSNGALYWWWTGGSLTTGSGAVPVGAWTHVAFVYSRSAGSLQAFVNGAQVANQSYSALMETNNNPFYIGTDIGSGDGAEIPERRFYGSIDEVRIYNGALSGGEITALMNETDPCGPTIDHYEIVHDGSALTCAPEPVTVRACADADCSTLYTDDVVINLSPSGWVGGDTQTLSGGSGVFHLRHTSQETVTLSVSSRNPAADSVLQCVDGTGGSSCNLTFRDAGFLFDVPDLTSCAQEENILIAAVRSGAAGECIGDDSVADSTHNVRFWSSYQQPATGTRPVYVNGVAVAGASPGTVVRLSFDSEAQSLLSVRYADAGRVALTARFGGWRGTDSFVAAPHHLLVSAEQTDGNPLNSTDPDGSYHIPAGENFTVEVSGVCSDDSVTPNFAATTALNATAANPAPGTFTGGPMVATDYVEGTVTGTAAYSEVGTVTLQAVATNYLGSGRDVSGSADVGRFTPARFALSWYQSPELTPACSSGRFTYVGQTFDYAAEPVVKITALNVQGDVTQNYTQPGWWKITNAALLSGRSYSAAEGSFEISGGGASYAYPVVGEPGSGTLTYDEESAMRFVRGGIPVAPFFADIDLQINVVDADGISASAPLSIEDIPFSGEDKTGGINTDEMRWGRLAMQNAYGSELLDLPMPLRAEYYDGSSFVTNLDDNCTNLSVSQLSLSGTVTSMATLHDNPSSPLSTGDAGLVFSAPNATGYIDVRLDLSLLPWLRYDWDGDTTHDDDPAGRATFGIYSSRPSLIYRRETYR